MRPSPPNFRSSLSNLEGPVKIMCRCPRAGESHDTLLKICPPPFVLPTSADWQRVRSQIALAAVPLMSATRPPIFSALGQDFVYLVIRTKPPTGNTIRLLLTSPETHLSMLIQSTQGKMTKFPKTFRTLCWRVQSHIPRSPKLNFDGYSVFGRGAGWGVLIILHVIVL